MHPPAEVFKHQAVKEEVIDSWSETVNQLSDTGEDTDDTDIPTSDRENLPVIQS